MKSKIENLKLENIDCRELKPLQGDLKVLTTQNYQRLKKSFSEKNMFAPLLVWKSGKEKFLLDGHGRLRLFNKEKAIFVGEGGKETHEVPCIVIPALNLQDAKEKLLIITSQYQTLTQDGLDEFAFDLGDEWLKSTTIFDALTDFDALQEEEDNQSGLTDDDAVPEVPKTAKTKVGDLYILGDHRLLCGDSTKKEDVEKVLSGKIPLLMVTDPPYGVEYDPMWRDESGISRFGKTKAIGKVENDDIADWTAAWALFPGDIAYVWHSGLHTTVVAKNLEACDFAIRSQIIWVKPAHAMSRGDYHWRHEPCWYAVKKKKNGNWSGDRKQNTVWEFPGVNPAGGGGRGDDEKVGHGTQKPVECMRRPIVNNSLVRDIVYDPFLGSGTTMIAAQKADRICYGLELSPLYCDMIVQRWEDFTGQKAERMS